MSASNHRIKEHDTVHHLMSRIAHKVYILNDEDLNDLIEIVRRSAEFAGVKLLGWCLMTNHFHLLVYLPDRIEVPEDEVLRRYGVLKGSAAAAAKAEELKRLRTKGDDAEADAWLEKQRRRMYDIGSFMKITKQWFTEDYNLRYSHDGTLWSGEYVDRPVKISTPELAKRLAYIHLNPIRAAMTDRYDGYTWSSFTAFKRGDPLAMAGLRFVYGEWENRSDLNSQIWERRSDQFSQRESAELSSRHVLLLDTLLEAEKRRRAEEIARRRLAGYTVPCDPLTTEALVQQAKDHLEEVRRLGLFVLGKRSDRNSQDSLSKEFDSRQLPPVELQILALIYIDPSLEPSNIVKMSGQSKSSVYRALENLKRKGILERLDKSKNWLINQ